MASINPTRYRGFLQGEYQSVGFGAGGKPSSEFNRPLPGGFFGDVIWVGAFEIGGGYSTATLHHTFER
ncbi:hypothetical protein D3C78_1666180 [compost metagenome]